MRLRQALATTAGSVGLLGMLATGAAAQDYPGGTTDERVEGEQLDRPDEVLGTVADRGAVAGARQDTLPVTGGDLAGLVVVGVSLVGVGTVIVRRNRRTETVAA